MNPASALTLYVSPGGSDGWSGHLRTSNKTHSDGPFATLERARDEIRALKQRSKILNGPIIIELAGGSYELAQTFTLDARDTGTSQAPIEYRAHRDEEVRLIGGKRVTGWKPVTDPAMLNRLDPAARGAIRQVDLRSQGLSGLPGPQGSPNWGQSKPGAELFFEDKPMTLARWPNAGTVRIAGVINGKPVDDHGTQSATEGKFIYDGDRPSRWAGENDAWLHGYWSLDWADQRQKIASIDAAKHVITLAKPDHTWGYRTNQWYYAFNILAELDQPGEWYLDHAGEILYFWPTTSLDKNQPVLSIIPTLVAMKDVSHVTLHGLTLEASQATAVTVEGGDDVSIKGCVIRNTGSWGVRITGAKNSRVVDSDIYYTGDGGIDLDGGDRKTLTSGGLYAENNHIHHYSRWNPVYNAGVRLNGVANRARHNLIHDAPHMAIGLIGNDHLIEFNEIHNVCGESNDAGVIYAGQDWSMRGNIIRYNYLHNVYGRNGHGCMGIYLDDNFSSATIYGNVFYQVPRTVFLGGGRDNIVDNNIFVECAPAVNVDARGLGWRANGKDDLTKRLEEMPYRTEPWRSRYPQLMALLTDDPMAPKGVSITRNICVNGQWSNIETSASPYVTLKDNIVEGDLHLMDSPIGKFALAKDSPALKLGFKPIPLKQIGLQQSPDRPTWPVAHPALPKPLAP